MQYLHLFTFSVSFKSIDAVYIQYKFLCQKCFVSNLIFSIFGEQLFTLIYERGIPFFPKTFHPGQLSSPKDVLGLTLCHQKARVIN